MKIPNRKIRIVVLMLLIVSHVVAQNPNLGTAGAQFLKIPIGARSAALGGAVTVMSEDATALFWNPAGILQDHKHALHVSHIPWMTFFDVNAVAYTLSKADRGALGIYARTLGMEKMEVTTEYQPEGTGDFFDAQDLELGIGYARKLIDPFVFGVNVKYIRQRIWHESASGFAFDLGTLYNLDMKNTVISMSLRNFGSDLRMEGPDLLVFYEPTTEFPSRLIPSHKETEAYPLPLTFQFGLGIDLVDARFLHSRLGVEMIHYNDFDEQVLVGLETTFAQRFVIRGGYRYSSSQHQPSLGVGLRQRIDKMVIKVDYAYVLHDYLGDTRFISLDLVL